MAARSSDAYDVAFVAQPPGQCGGSPARSWSTKTPTAPSWVRTCSGRPCRCSLRVPLWDGMESGVARDSGAVVAARRMEQLKA